MDPIQSVKPKNSRTLMVNFSLRSGASHYIIRVQNSNGFFREDRVSSSPAEIHSLMPYTEYTLSIMAANSGGRSQPSLPVTAKTGMIVYLLSVKETLQGRFLYPKWVMLSPGSSVYPIIWHLMACRSHSICCIVYYNLSPVSVFGKMQDCFTWSEHQDPSGLLRVTGPDNSDTMA